MKFSCTRDNLTEALTEVGGVTGKNINLPILNNILITAQEQKIIFAATNLELAITATIGAKVEAPGAFTVPGRTLLDFSNLLTNDKVDLELIGQELNITCGKSKTKIKGIPADEFPVIPTAESGTNFKINSEELKSGLAKVVNSAAKNDIRPELSGVLFNFSNSGELTIAATDSYRLAEKKLNARGGGEKRIIVPGRTAQEILRVLSSLNEAGKEVEISVTEGQVSLTCKNLVLVSRLIDGEYPDYIQIIPKSFTTNILINTNSLLQEMKAAGLFTTSGVNAVNIKADPGAGSLAITSTSTQTGEYQSEIEAEVGGKEVETVLNNRYVLDGLNHLSSDKTKLGIVNSDSPCVFKAEGDDSYLYIVMPIRQ